MYLYIYIYGYRSIFLLLLQYRVVKKLRDLMEFLRCLARAKRISRHEITEPPNVMLLPRDIRDC